MTKSEFNFRSQKYCSAIDDLFLPTVMFAALGGMTWAVRGCSGFGAVAGCLFAGVMWGSAWWYMAYQRSGVQVRRYSSAWIILAVTLGIGLSGARGWMQWSTFFEGHLQTNTGKGEWVPISRTYGFLWMFIAGMPWAGIGACTLAWCGSLRETRVWHWGMRIACGVGTAMLARYFYQNYPSWFLPMYDELQERYLDVEANPNLRRLTNDCGAAVLHMGFYLGFLLYEFLRRDWKNVILILVVGIVNGTGWAAFQTWKFSATVWKDSNFNFWRCWESSGGISIGVAFGLAWFLVNRRMSDREQAITAERSINAGSVEWFLIFCGLTAFGGSLMQFQMAGWNFILIPMLYGFAGFYCVKSQLSDPAMLNSLSRPVAILVTAFCVAHLLPLGGAFLIVPGFLASGIVFLIGVVWFIRNRPQFEVTPARSKISMDHANLQRFGLALGLLTGLGLSIRNGAKGWFNIYVGNEDYWSGVLWWIVGPLLVIVLLAIIMITLKRIRHSQPTTSPPGLAASAALWLVLIVQNILGHLVTGPPSQWNEVVFNIYYFLLFLITAVIAIHYAESLSPTRDSRDVRDPAKAD